MNELSLFQQPEKTMTVKEIADVMGVSTDTIKNCIRRVYPDKMQNGKTTYLNEKEVACISFELKNNNSVLSHQTYEVSSQVQNAITDLEVISSAATALKNLQALLDRKEKEYQKIIEAQRPKVEAYDNFISHDNFCNFRDGANYLHIKQTDLMNFLKTKYIYKNSIGEYRAYSEYSKYFVLRPFDKGYDRTGQQLMFSLEDLEYFKNKISA